jgi:hypothetical protein
LLLPLFSSAHPEVELGPVTDYGLYICEDNGEVEWDFPCLDAKEACSKFGLDCLGLVDLKTASKNNPDIQTCSISEKGELNAIGQSEETISSTLKQQNSETSDQTLKGSAKAGAPVQRAASSVTFRDTSINKQRSQTTINAKIPLTSCKLFL